LYSFSLIAISIDSRKKKKESSLELSLNQTNIAVSMAVAIKAMYIATDQRSILSALLIGLLSDLDSLMIHPS
jgi:hypothetical protein